MPSSQKNRESAEALIEQNRLVPLEQATGVLEPGTAHKGIPIPGYPPAPNSFLRTPLPAVSIQQPDQQRQWQTPATPQNRISPTPATSNPVVGSQAASQTIVVIQGGNSSGSSSGAGGSIISSGGVFETNNIKNTSQNTLNLIQGANITLNADSQGGVTISSTGTFSGTFISGSGVPAGTGAIRLSTSDTICWRNATNSADICISKGVGTQPEALNLGAFFLVTAGQFSSSAVTTFAGGSFIRMASADSIAWRNNADTADIKLNKTAAGEVTWNSTAGGG